MMQYQAGTFDDIENVYRYKRGGYHPVKIGDIFQDKENRYEVVHKLGYGTFSTVWLVQDGTDAFYALKVLCADTKGDDELSILKYLQGTKHQNVVHLVSYFELTGPNGRHQCLILPLLGPSLQDVLSPVNEGGLSGLAKGQVCQQISAGIDSLHKLGVCHGDLTPSNILFKLPVRPSSTLDQIYHLLGRPSSQRQQLRKGASVQVTETARFPRSEADLRDEDGQIHVCIADLGQAFFVLKPPRTLGIPMPFLAPEVLFGEGPEKSDIWALGCILFFIQTDRYVAPLFFDDYGQLIMMIHHAFGPLPTAWKGRSSTAYPMPQQIQEEGQPSWWFEDSVPMNKPLAKVINKRATHLSDEKQQQLKELLEGLLAYEPSKRYSAEQAVKHPFFDNIVTENIDQNGRWAALPTLPL